MGIWFLFAPSVFQIFQISSADSTDNSTEPNCNSQASVGYASSSGCIFSAIQNTPLRVVYLDKQYVTQNQAAIAKATALGLNYTFGKTCENPTTAVPEWLDTFLIRFIHARRNHFLTGPSLQFCCRKLAVWMDGPVYVGNLFQLSFVTKQ